MMPEYNLDELKGLGPIDAAKRLLGALLIRTLPTGQIITKIVEVEAYDETDPASHSFVQKSKRNMVLFEGAGLTYIYQIHGIHYCMDIVTGLKGTGASALIRAIEPIAGIEQMIKARPNAKDLIELCNGPAKLTKALSIDKGLYGHDLRLPPLQCLLSEPLSEMYIEESTRIGISNAQDEFRRFYDTRSNYVSRKH